MSFIYPYLLMGALAVGLSGCFNTGEVEPVRETVTGSSYISNPAPGPRAAQIIFRQTNPGGSFPPAPTAGTPAQVGSGLDAVRIFNADGSALAQGGPTDPNWPKFIKRVQISIGGSNNNSAPSAQCARFGTPADNSVVCAPDPPSSPTFDQPCGCPDQSYCVAEYGCAQQSAIKGNGGPTDGIYILVELDRSTDALAPHENLMAVLDVTVSGMNGGPANPQSCFSNGRFDASRPECADLSWYMYLKHDIGNIYQPFSVLIPPIPSGVNREERRLGSQRISIERILPVSADPGIKYIQISRIFGLPTSSPRFTSTCFSGGTNAAFSPRCVGVVFHSLTFFRI